MQSGSMFGCGLPMQPPSSLLPPPFEGPTIFDQLPRFIFNMPRVVPDQRGKFESDDLFRKISRECEVRYTAFRDRPKEERQLRFQNGCREGHTDIAYVASGINLQLAFTPCPMSPYNPSYCDFSRERGKVHIRSCFIMNGVCVRWRGWIDLERLDGVGCLEFDEERAKIEDAILHEQVDRYNQRIKEFEQRQNALNKQAELEMEVARRKLADDPILGKSTITSSHLHSLATQAPTQLAN